GGQAGLRHRAAEFAAVAGGGATGDAAGTGDARQVIRHVELVGDGHNNTVTIGPARQRIDLDHVGVTIDLVGARVLADLCTNLERFVARQVPGDHRVATVFRQGGRIRRVREFKQHRTGGRETTGAGKNL